jgi:hypothetical protein
MSMLKNLYLVQGAVYREEDDGKSTHGPVLRLVWANSKYEAEELMEREYNWDSWGVKSKIEITSIETALS